MIAQGVIRRRRRIARPATAYDVDGRANRRLAERHGEAPLPARVGRRTLVIPLTMDDALEILGAAPEPFTPASREVRAGLALTEMAEPGWRLGAPDLRHDRPLPAMLDHFRVCLSRR